MMFKINNFLKKIFIFNWNLFSKINFFYNHNFKFKKNSLKHIKVLIVKPSNYSDLYSAGLKNTIETIKSSQYRMGPIGILTEFNAKVVISNYYKEQKIPIKQLVKDKRFHYFSKQYKQGINFSNFDFTKFDWVFSIKDSIPKNVIKKNPKVLWTLLFEDHKEKNYLKDNFFGNQKYDLTFDTTQGFTLYDIFKSKKSISFPYTFTHNNISKQLRLKDKKKKQIVLEIYQPKNLSFNSLGNFEVAKLDGNLKISEYFKLLSTTKYFYCPIYTLPRWGNSIIEAAAFNCLIIGNPNCFWNGLLIQDECIAKNHTDGLKILKRFESDKILYKKILTKQKKIFNKINFYRPLSLIEKNIKKNFKEKKIFKLF